MGKIKLSEILDLFNGFAFKSTDYVDKSNVLNCRMSNIRPDGRFDILYNPRYLPENYADKFSNYKLRDGDLIVAMTDLAGDPKILGVPTIVQTNGTTILLNQRVGKLILKEKEKIFVPWLRYNLGRKEVQKYYSRFSNGGLQINLGKNDLLSYEIEITPLSTQKAIADKLDKADALRKKDKELLAQYDELAQAIFIDMFGDPVRNEKGWKTHKAKTIFNFSSGKFNSTKNLDASYAFPTYGGNGITGFSSSFLIDFPTIVIGRVGAYCGSIHITDEKSWITDNAIYIKSIPKEVNLVFLYFFLINYKLNRFADYSGQPKITQKPLEDIDFFIVDINLQNQFAEKIKNIEAQKAIVKQQAQQSEDLFQALLQESFNFN